MSERKVRKLERSENIRTKALYEMVFPEDQGAFADYYYEEIATQNEIYVVEENEAILAMLHLNFYDLVVDQTEKWIPYIVAVATHPDYRHQGLMSALLKKAFAELWAEGVPFAYLMPASEAIYRPFGFQYISKINNMELPVKAYLNEEKLAVRPATRADVPDLCWFSNRYLKKAAGTYARRTESYYERLLLEQECQGGSIAVLEKDGLICGWFYALEEEEIPEVRELVVEKEYETLLFPTVADCFRYDEKVQLYAFPESLRKENGGEKPLMMGRIADVKAYLSLVKKELPSDFCVKVTDDLIPENNGCYRLKDGRIEKTADQEEAKECCVKRLMERFPLPGPVFLYELV